MNSKPNCYVCDKLIKSNCKRKLWEAPLDVQEAAEMHRLTRQPPLEPLIITADVFCCQNCLAKAIKVVNDQENDEKVEFNVLSQRSRELCFVCEHKCNNRITFQARIKIYVESNIYVPHGTRMCHDHYTDDGIYLRSEFLQGLSYVKRKIHVPISELHKWVIALGTEVKTAMRKRFNDESEFTEDEFVTFTSLTKAQYNNLYSYCKPVELYRVKNRRITKKDLLMFLIKLRQGLSDDFLNIMFRYSSRQAVSLAVAKVRKSLMENFVPSHLGVDAITRDDYIDKHVTPFANELYNPCPNQKVVILYIDGTYIKVPKSSCYRILRQSFCTHKGYHLVKPIMIVAPDGYILDVHGPYFSDGKNNDAACLNHELENDIQGFRSWLQEDDIFIVDRGYRDSTTYLESIGMKTQMPAYLKKGDKQHTTEEANKSRLITSTRWVVEARNGHVKSKFKLFRNTVDIHHLPNIGDFFRIACALINAYHPLIGMREATVDRARKLLDKASNAVNVVQQRVIEDRLHLSSGNWFKMNQAHAPGFPILPLEYLRDLTLGVYQLKLSRSYVQDKFDSESEYEFEVNLDIPGLLRARTCSRHKGSTRYRIYIAYVEQNFEERIGETSLPLPQEEPINGWYCNCKAGSRTVGCCAHVSSVMWYLGYARYEERINYPSHAGLSAIRDAANRPMPLLINSYGTLRVGAVNADIINVEEEENNILNVESRDIASEIQEENNILNADLDNNEGEIQEENNILNADLDDNEAEIQEENNIFSIDVEINNEEDKEENIIFDYNKETNDKIDTEVFAEDANTNVIRRRNVFLTVNGLEVDQTEENMDTDEIEDRFVNDNDYFNVESDHEDV